MNTNIGISPKNLQGVVNELVKLLADEFVLYTKTRNAHWNVEGPDFHSMHIFFEQQYEALDETMDSVAERMRQIGHAEMNISDRYTYVLEQTRCIASSRQRHSAEGRAGRGSRRRIVNATGTGVFTSVRSSEVTIVRKRSTAGQTR